MPSAEFCKSISANLAYWLDRSRDLDDKKLHHLDGERHNLYRAVQFGLGVALTRCDAASLILEIYPLIERRGYWQRWIPLLEEAVASCAGADGTLTIRLLDRLGQCYRLDRQWEASLARHGREEELARALGDEGLLAKAHLNLSQTYWSMRQYDQAVRYGELALAGFESAGGNVEQMAAATSNLGLIAQGRGELATAENWLKQTAAAYRLIDRPALLARTLMNLAVTLQQDGRNEEVLPLCHEALRILEPTEHELDKVRVELTLGTSYLYLNRLEEAKEAYKRADSPALRRIGHSFLMARAANDLGYVFMQLGRLEESEGAISRSIALWRQTGGRLQLANSLGSMAETKLAMNSPEEALPYLDEAVAIAAEYPDDGWGRQILAQYAQMREELRVANWSGE